MGPVLGRFVTERRVPALPDPATTAWASQHVASMSFRAGDDAMTPPSRSIPSAASAKTSPRKTSFMEDSGYPAARARAGEPQGGPLPPPSRVADCPDDVGFGLGWEVYRFGTRRHPHAYRYGEGLFSFVPSAGNVAPASSFLPMAPVARRSCCRHRRPSRARPGTEGDRRRRQLTYLRCKHTV